MSTDPIKSVRRVFEILELFNQERCPLSANTISKRLNYPLTSAHALLKSMHDLGYAAFDQSTWCYTPSPDAAALLDWVRDSLTSETNIMECVSALSYETRETINVSRPIDTNVRIIFGLESVYNVGVSVKVGTLMPATRSLTGLASLSCFSQRDFDAFFDQLPSSDPDQARQADRNDVESVVQEFQRNGMVMKCDLYVQGIGAVCTPVLTANASSVLIIGIVGPSDRIAENSRDYSAILRRLLKRHGVKPVHRIRTPRGRRIR